MKLLVSNILLVLAAVSACYLVFAIFRNGEWLIALSVLMVSAAAIFTYGHPRAYTWRYLFPGLFGFSAFVILPLVYTVYIAFTNYSGANLLSREQVRHFFEEETVLTSKSMYNFEVFGAPGSGTIYLYPADADQGYTARWQGDATQLTARPGHPPSGAPWPIKRVWKSRIQLAALEVRIPDGKVYRMIKLRQFGARTNLWIPHGDAFTNRITGEKVKPDDATGFYRNRRGESVGPGYTVLVGLKNFIRVMTDPGLKGPFLKIFAWNLSFAFLSVLLTFGLGMFLAVLLEWESLAGRKIYRTLLILPYAVPAFLSIMIFKGLFNPNFGDINDLLQNLIGIRPEWTTNPWLARTMIIIVNTWLGFPYMMILCTGVLQSIPKNLYEASAVDGAGALTNFFRITMPLVLKPLRPLLIASFAFNFNNFSVIYLLTKGNPDMVGASTIAGQTDILVSYTYRIAFNDAAADFGLASAIGTLLFLLVGGLSWLNLKMSRST